MASLKAQIAADDAEVLLEEDERPVTHHAPPPDVNAETRALARLNSPSKAGGGSPGSFQRRLQATGAGSGGGSEVSDGWEMMEGDTLAGADDDDGGVSSQPEFQPEVCHKLRFYNSWVQKKGLRPGADCCRVLSYRLLSTNLPVNDERVFSSGASTPLSN